MFEVEDAEDFAYDVARDAFTVIERVVQRELQELLMSGPVASAVPAALRHPDPQRTYFRKPSLRLND